MFDFTSELLKKINIIEQEEVMKEDAKKNKASQLFELAENKLLESMDEDSIKYGKVKVLVDYPLNNVDDIDNNYLRELCSEHYITPSISTTSFNGRVYIFRINIDKLTSSKTKFSKDSFEGKVLLSLKRIEGTIKRRRDYSKNVAKEVYELAQQKLVKATNADALRDGKVEIKMEITPDLFKESYDIKAFFEELVTLGKEDCIALEWNSGKEQTVFFKLNLNELKKKYVSDNKRAKTL